MQIQKPTEADLKPLYTEALQGQTEESWTEKILSSIAGILRKSPLRYRTYGPFWWLVKEALIDHGYTEFGEHIDIEWLNDLETGDRVYDLLLAWVYEEGRFSVGQMITDPYHSLICADGEPFEYVSGDEEMELKAVVIR